MHSMDSADKAVVYFSHHALSLKGLPALEPEQVHKYFNREDLVVADNKEMLEATMKRSLANAEKPLCLLLMSSGTFDGIDWNAVSSQ